MPTSKILESLLRKHDPHRDQVSPDIHPCQGAKFHSPRPLMVHACRLTNGQQVFLCGTCLDNLKAFLFLNGAEGTLEWEVLRSFGNDLRSIAILEVSAIKAKGKQ